MDDQASDADLIQASIEDPVRFEPIFDRYYRRVFGYLAKKVGTDAAGDLTSDVFTAAFAQRHRFRLEAENAAPWLFGIAANLARRHARSLRRRARALQRTAHSDYLWLDPDIEARVDAQRELQALNSGLAALRAADREVLLLYALADLTYAEIADALRIPIGTVRSRLSRARRRLRNHLQGFGQYPVGETGPGEVNND